MEYWAVCGGDHVEIIGGHQKGVRGTVLKLFVRSDGHVSVFVSKLDDPSIRCTVSLEHIRKIKK